jgi:hypothetical protein
MSWRGTLGTHLTALAAFALGAAPPAGTPPFVDATVQREEMLRELRSIRDLLKEQNALLKEVLQKNHGNPANKR